MNWKNKLRNLEHNKEWDEAIEFMQQVIKDNPDDMDAYIFMNYLIMNLLVEEMYDITKHDYYESLAKYYFKESYTKFSHNPGYLYYTGITAYMSEWYFGIDREDADKMLEQAKILDPQNPIYQFNDYWSLFTKNRHNPEAIAYAQMVLSKDSPVKNILKHKGALGAYLLEIMTGRCEKIIGIHQYLP